MAKMLWTDREIFSFRLQIAMREKNLNVWQLARMINKTAFSITRWINMETDCHLSIYPKLSEALDKPVHWFTTKPTDEEIERYTTQA